METTTTTRVKPKFIALLTSGAGSALNAGMLWFNLISLNVAYKNLQNDRSLETGTGFAASFLGLAGATAATLVSVRAAHKLVILRYRQAAPGMAFGNGIMKFLDSDIFARAAGYPATVLGFISDRSRALNQETNGDQTRANYTFTGGLATATGSIITLETALALAGPTVVVPFAGWAAMALIVVGVAVIAGGVYLHAKANERVHSPIELWAARSIFGNRRNDGEARRGITLDHNYMLPAFASLQSEVKEWHSDNYRPRLITAKEALHLGVPSIGTQWHKDTDWSYVAPETITPSGTAKSNSKVELSILLPGFILGASQWSAKRASKIEPHELDISSIMPTPHLISAGLILHFEAITSHYQHASLHLVYTVHHRLSETTEINSTFRLER